MSFVVRKEKLPDIQMDEKAGEHDALLIAQHIRELQMSITNGEASKCAVCPHTFVPGDRPENYIFLTYEELSWVEGICNECIKLSDEVITQRVSRVIFPEDAGAEAQLVNQANFSRNEGHS